jgi:16S rRNA (cytidine1402-2'-O)-methyltransferase
VLAGAPLGNPGDASTRLRDALASAAVIAAEDTRRLRRLCADLGVRPSGRVVSFFEANESARVPMLLEALRAGDDVLVVTDAGMPSVSDPGYRLVAAAAAEGLVVTVLPGPSAVLAALAVSGLPVDRFCFEGFPPRKAGERRRLLAALAGEARTMVFFEAPHRLEATLSAMAEAFGPDRRAAVCRELTKTYEEVRRGGLGELAGWAGGEVRGEITVVVAGSSGTLGSGVGVGVGVGVGEAAGGLAALASRVAAREAAGETRKEAIAAVAAELGIAKRTVFDAVVAGKGSD